MCVHLYKYQETMKLKEITYEKDNIYTGMHSLELPKSVCEHHFDIQRNVQEVFIQKPT